MGGVGTVPVGSDMIPTVGFYEYGGLFGGLISCALGLLLVTLFDSGHKAP